MQSIKSKHKDFQLLKGLPNCYNLRNKLVPANMHIAERVCVKKSIDVVLLSEGGKVIRKSKKVVIGSKCARGELVKVLFSGN